MTTSNSLETDFDTLLTLEESFYDTGYAEGLADGRTQGHTEGRLFGLAKGFEKFHLLGQIHGRASVWRARQGVSTTSSTAPSESISTAPGTSTPTVTDAQIRKIALPNPRLTRHLDTLLETLETVEVRNGDDEVAQMEDARKRVLGKVRVLESILKEKVLEGLELGGDASGEVGIEETRKVPGRG